MSKCIGLHLHQLNGKSYAESLIEFKKAFPELCDVQVFTHVPYSLKKMEHDANLLPTAKKLGVDIVVHGSYLCVPWKSQHLADHTLENIIAAQKYHSFGAIAHMPYMPPKEMIDGLDYLIKKMRRKHITNKLILEISALPYDEKKSYETAEKINELEREIRAHGFEPEIGICIDTAHVFAGGGKIRTYDEAKTFIDKLDKRLIVMIHLNGNSHDPAVIKGDKHEIPLTKNDLIWHDLTYEEAGCRAFIEFARDANIPCILETNQKNHTFEEIRTFFDKIGGTEKNDKLFQNNIHESNNESNRDIEPIRF
jgi:endonuclease IV